MELYVTLGIASALAVVIAQYFWPRPRTVREYQRGLRYRRGHLLDEHGPGRYWLRPRIDELDIYDTRRSQSVIAGQEVLTSDRVPLKISLIVEYTVSDLSKAVLGVDNYRDALYGRVQLALREVTATLDLDEALAQRGDLGRRIFEIVEDSAAELGITLHSVQARDFMMAGGLRGAYADVIEAKQKGLAALERARGESAAVRSLANAAQLMERHPGIMQLRLLQAVEAGSGNRIVIALDPERGKSTDVEIVAEGDA